uniref:Putative insulin growth factor binding protein n=1 Tax=Ixodes ricinus TaxID=34613 RepID=A0A0K8RK35_IXORI
MIHKGYARLALPVSNSLQSANVTTYLFYETKSIALNSLGSFIYYNTIVNTNMAKIFYVKENEANGEDATWQKNKVYKSQIFIFKVDLYFVAFCLSQPILSRSLALLFSYLLISKFRIKFVFLH